MYSHSDFGKSFKLVITEEPDKETQDMVDAIRVPKGKAVLAADH